MPIRAQTLKKIAKFEFLGFKVFRARWCKNCSGICMALSISLCCTNRNACPTIIGHRRAGGRGEREKIWAPWALPWGPMGPRGSFLEFWGAAHGPWGPGGAPGVPWGALRGQLFATVGWF